MELLTNMLNELNSIVWGPVMLVLLLGTGIYLTLSMRFLTFRKIPTGFKMLWTRRKINTDATGELSPFNALMTAMAATIGTGNIAGVATAIFTGGPGALFWMWCTALVGMATKFAEILLAVHYREVTPAGNVVGGPMYYIKNGLGKKWEWMGILFCIFGTFAAFGIGNTAQVNSIAQALEGTFSVPTWATGAALFVIVGAVVLGGLKRIGEVAGRIVPFMAFFYILASVVVVILNISELPSVIAFIVRDAFTPTAAAGGFAGATVWMAIRFGVARGVFSNEAGMGSAPIAHATATVKNPMTQALIGMLETFIDTLIVCTMTGFAILVTGKWTSGLTGAQLTTSAFEQALPGIGGVLVTVALTLFAFSTILGWCVYSERCIMYLFGERMLTPWRVLFTCIVPIGAVAQLDFVWLLSDTFNALMAIPNLLALLMLSPVVFRLIAEYFKGEGTPDIPAPKDAE